MTVPDRNHTDAVVLVSSDDVTGTGFFVAPGYVLTCSHVVRPDGAGAGPVVRWRGRDLAVTVVALEPEERTSSVLTPLPNLALLRLHDSVDHPTLTIAQSPPEIGQPLLLEGFSRVYSDTPGRFTASMRLSGYVGLGDQEALNLDGGEIPPGSSGGPVLDTVDHSVVGVVTSTRGEGRNGGLAVPASLVREFLARRLPPGEPLPPPSAVPTNDPALVGIRGFGDAPAEFDRLGRKDIARTLARLLSPRRGARRPDEAPTVVVVDGPWGSGKTSLLRQTFRILQHAADGHAAGARAGRSLRSRLTEWRKARRLTVAGAHRLLGVWRRPSTVPGSASIAPATDRPPPVVAWFEPWAYQTSEQLWAGLTKAITEAAVSAVCHSANARRRFWFARNAERLDTTRLRREIRRGVMSPLLRVAVIALTIPVVAQLTRPDADVDVWGIERTQLAWGLPASILAIGLLHTAARYLFGRVDAFLPEELFTGPVLSGAMTASAPDPVLRDPLHQAKSGGLYLAQHDVELVLGHLRTAKRELVVFIDDLDRCSPRTSVEVLQAINLFLSGRLSGGRFVIGVDQVVIAAQLDDVYAYMADTSTIRYGDDPTPGWSFLRKLVQLPIALPAVTREQLNRYLRHLLGEVAPARRSTAAADGSAPTAERGDATPVTGQAPADDEPGDEPEPIEDDEVVEGLERDAGLRALLEERLIASHDPSGREAKRLLTIWQFYIRVTAEWPGLTPSGRGELAARLVYLAEITARWPAIVRQFRIAVDGAPGIIALAQAVDDDFAWRRVLGVVKLDGLPHRPAVKGLRQLLREHDGEAVARLAARLL